MILQKTRSGRPSGKIIGSVNDYCGLLRSVGCTNFLQQEIKLLFPSGRWKVNQCIKETNAPDFTTVTGLYT